MGLATLFGVVIPYVAIAVFVLGVVWRVVQWARVPVPFRIPTTCGQGKSLPWIKADNLECPYNTWGVIGRMVLEVLFFRSLFRNTKAELRDGPNVYVCICEVALAWRDLVPLFIPHHCVETLPVLYRACPAFCRTYLFR